MASEKFCFITPLNDKNYATWKLQMKMLLIKEDLFSLVDGTETVPAEGATPAAVSTYNKKKSKTLANLVLAVDPKLLYLLGDPTDPREVWQKLENTFQMKTWSNKLRLKKKLYNMKLESGENLQEHLKSFIELFDELSILGDPVSEEDRVINLLASLPDQFSTLVTALEAQEKVPTWDIVTQRLLHEDIKKSESKNNNGNQAQALAAVKKSYSGNGKVCYYCNKPGHFKKNCFKYKNSLKQRGSDSQSTNYVFENDVALYVTALKSEFTDSDVWIIDSGATARMCNNASLFSSLKSLDNSL